jgi:hypothetical protein
LTDKKQGPRLVQRLRGMNLIRRVCLVAGTRPNN